MIGRCVLDASSTLAWLFGDAEDPERLSTLLLGRGWIAPWLWRLEVLQAVTRRERQKRISLRRDPVC